MIKANVANLYTSIVYDKKLRYKDGRPYINRGKYWEPVKDMEVYKCIYDSIKDNGDITKVTKHMVNEVAFKLQNNSDFEIRFVNDDKCNFLNVNNGVYNFENNIFLQNVDRPNFSYVLDFNYIRNPRLDDAPVFKKFVQETFADDYETKLQLLLECISYCISDYDSAKAAFFFVGCSNSGKSVLLTLLNRILPKCVVTSVALDKLDNKFALATLKYSKLNILTELNKKSLKHIDIFKQITSCEEIYCEEKNCEGKSVRIKTKCINATNVLPQLDEVEGMTAILNRMVILKFNHFVEKCDMDLHLVDKLYEERDVIFSLAMKQIPKLIKNNFQFTEPKDSRMIKEEYKMIADIIDNFIEEKCIIDSSKKVFLKDIYDSFKLFCIENGIPEAKVDTLELRNNLSSRDGIKRKKIRIGDSSLWGFVGLGLNSTKSVTQML